ncbi:MAG: BCCT family transporter [Firmicutes bacterium]|nr:BCCT family transporter [Bacillota bacterium]
MEQTKSKVTIRKPVFISMGAIYVFIIVLGLVAPAQFAAAETAIVEFACLKFGWAYQLLTVVLLAFCFWVLFSKKIGNIKLGGEKSEPVMSKWAWFVISLCGGIATGIVFWGIAEPVTHYMDGIPLFENIEAATPMAAKMALSTTFLHWGLAEYCYYCVAGIVIGVAVYNMKLPYRVSSCLYPILGEKAMGWIGTVIDVIGVFGLAGGVSASLCEGALQMGAGLGIVAHFDPGKFTWICSLVAVVITFLLSSYTGIARGVRFFSDMNAKIYMALLAFVLFFGPTFFILNLACEALGFHVTHFMEQVTYTGAWNDGDMWPTWWTVNYWSWMIAYAPLMGIFCAKVARGRTLKQFTIYNFLLPGGFGVLWFSIFGSSSIFYEKEHGTIWSVMNDKGTESAVFAYFDNLPITTIMSIIFLFTIFISIVTLADSMTTTISSLSINAKNAATVEPPTKIKIFWGITLSLVCFVNLATASDVGAVSGIDATKQLAISVAFPLLIVMILMVISGFKMLIQYDKYDTVDHPENSVVSKKFIIDYDIDDVID